MLSGNQSVDYNYNCRQDHMDRHVSFEKDEKEVIQLVYQVEERNVRDVSVLLVMPDNTQRLIQLEVPIDNDECSILQVVQTLLDKKKECRLDMYAVSDERYNFHYVIEVDLLQSDNKNDESISIINVNESLDIIDDSSSIESSNNSKCNILFDESDQSINDSPIVKDNSVDSKHSNKVHFNPVLLEKDNKIKIKIDSGNEVEVQVEIEEHLLENNKAVAMEKTCYDKIAMEETCHQKINVKVTKEYQTEIETSATESNDTSKSELKASEEIIQLEDSPILSRRKAKRRISKLSKINILTIYPASPAKGGIAINSEDFKCLAADEFLNDAIIDFYLKYLLHEVLSMDDRLRTHIFSSHFYTRLAKPYPSASNDGNDMTITARRHAGVKRWTKNVNIFEKDFVIVPVNEHAHWFLAIICFPNLVGTISDSTNCSDNEEVKKPCILIFDSLLGTRKTRVTKILRGYLYYEYLSKIQERKSFTKSLLPTVHPRIPKQSNVTDCGIFLLQYVENFFKDPIKNFTLPLRDLKNWFEPITIIRKRKEIASLIGELAKDYNKDKTVKLPDIIFHNPKVKLIWDDDKNHTLIVNDKKLCKVETNQSALQKSVKLFYNIVSNQSLSEKSDASLCKVKSKETLTEESENSLYEDKTIDPSVVSRFVHHSQNTYGNMVSLARSSAKDNNTKNKKESNNGDRNEKTSTSLSVSSIDEPMNCVSTSNTSSDAYYSLSFEALKNDPKISPNISYSNYLKAKKKFQDAEKRNDSSSE